MGQETQIVCYSHTIPEVVQENLVLWTKPRPQEFLCKCNKANEMQQNPFSTTKNMLVGKKANEHRKCCNASATAFISCCLLASYEAFLGW